MNETICFDDANMRNAKNNSRVLLGYKRNYSEVIGYGAVFDEIKKT